MIQPADFTRVGILDGVDVYSLPNREPGNHGGRYVEIEHVHDAMVAFNDVLEILRKAKVPTTLKALRIPAMKVAIEIAETKIEAAIEKLK